VQESTVRGSTIGIVGREVTREGGHGLGSWHRCWYRRTVGVLLVQVPEHRQKALDKATTQRTSSV